MRALIVGLPFRYLHSQTHVMNTRDSTSGEKLLQVETILATFCLDLK